MHRNLIYKDNYRFLSITVMSTNKKSYPDISMIRKEDIKTARNR